MVAMSHSVYIVRGVSRVQSTAHLGVVALCILVIVGNQHNSASIAAGTDPVTRCPLCEEIAAAVVFRAPWITATALTQPGLRAAVLRQALLPTHFLVVSHCQCLAGNCKRPRLDATFAEGAALAPISKELGAIVCVAQGVPIAVFATAFLFTPIFRKWMNVLPVRRLAHALVVLLGPRRHDEGSRLNTSFAKARTVRPIREKVHTIKVVARRVRCTRARLYATRHRVRFTVGHVPVRALTNFFIVSDMIAGQAASRIYILLRASRTRCCIDCSH